MEQIQKEAKKNGYEAYSFYGRGKPSNKNCFKIGNKLDIYWNVFLTRFFDKHGYGSKRATRRLVKRIKQINPSIIQIHNIHGYYLNLEILFNYLKEANIPVVWTLHDCWPFTGHCAHFTTIECEKWRNHCDNCPQIRSYPASWLIDNSFKQFELKKELFTGIKNLTVVTPSNWLREEAKKSFFKCKNVIMINNCIDTSIFKPIKDDNIKKRYDIPENKKIVLGVSSNWTKEKGIEYFINLANEINENDEFVVVIVGLTKKQIKSMPKNIIGIQKIEKIEELVKIYSVADVFFNPSIQETFSMVTLEAMACGVPCVVFNSTATPELIDNKVGIIIDSFQKKEYIYTKIKEVLGNGKNFYFENCIQKSQEYKLENYDKYINLYNSKEK